MDGREKDQNRWDDRGDTDNGCESGKREEQTRDMVWLLHYVPPRGVTAAKQGPAPMSYVIGTYPQRRQGGGYARRISSKVSPRENMVKKCCERGPKKITNRKDSTHEQH